MISAWALFDTGDGLFEWPEGGYGIMADLLSLDWRDSVNDSAVGKMYLVAAATDPAIEDLLDELQALSDISIKGTNKITKSTYANSVAASVRGAGHQFADDKVHLQLIYRTTNPAEFVRVSIYGPKESVPVGNDNKIDPTNAAFTDLTTQVIATVRSNSGATPTELMSGKLIFG